MGKRWLAVFAVLSAANAGVGPGRAAEEDAVGTVILDTKSFWRFRTIWETPEVVLPAGEVKHAQVAGKDLYGWYQKNPKEVLAPESMYAINEVPTVRLPAETAADWMKPGFDDSTWARVRGPMLDQSISENWKLILMRGLLEVTDPEMVGTLTVALTFRGGAVVYVNGEEVGRAFMPKGEVNLYTPAEPYPEEVYFSSEGFAIFRYDKSPDGAPRIEKRTRRIKECKVPAARFKKGVNVLAIAIHRAPTPAKFYASRVKNSAALHDDCFWAKIGLAAVRLTAPPGAAVVANTGPFKVQSGIGDFASTNTERKDRGFKIWNQSIIQTMYLPDYPDPFAPLSPVRLTGVRRGIFAGQVVVGDENPLTGLKVEVSDLKGPGAIPASAVRIRYALPDGVPGYGQPVFFDSLEDFPPEEVPVYKEHGGSVQPIWLTVNVPAEAKPGDYSGTVKISAEGIKPASVPLQLRLLDWALPDFRNFTSCMDLIQSPETVAMAYDVPLWSDEHFKLLDKTFAILAPLADKTLFISCIRRTHFGNEHAMVRWVRGDDGELTPDFSIVEKYLEVATKHLGKIPGVILYCWEPPESQGHAGGAGTAARTYDKPILITLVDPPSGKLSARQGPAWGSPEAKEFWKKLTDGLGPVLKKRGLENSLLFGLIGDCRPTKQAMDDITNGVPGAKWAVHSHYYCDNWQGYTIGMGIALWGIGVSPIDPTGGYSFGWSNPMWLAYYPREMKIQSTLVEHRVKLEKWMGAKRGYTAFVSKGLGPRGLGRIGADFWPVLRDDRGRVRGSLAGRYPEAAWGQLNLNFCIPYILGRGKNGPLATVRSEAFRESLQEVEARVYVEKALLDDGAKTLLGEDLIGRCRKALDERIRMCLHSDGEGQSWYISSDWNRRNELLFGLAAEVAKKYAGKEPAPNLKSEDKK